MIILAINAFFCCIKFLINGMRSINFGIDHSAMLNLPSPTSLSQKGRIVNKLRLSLNEGKGGEVIRR